MTLYFHDKKIIVLSDVLLLVLLSENGTVPDAHDEVGCCYLY